MTASGSSPVLALALSSSTGVMSAAVGPVGANGPLAAITLTTDCRHAEEISPLIQKLLADSGVTLGDLELVQRQLIEETNEYGELITANLWLIPSGRPLDLEWLNDLTSSARWLVTR